jgi:pyruvate dehydrogenase E2 component (dihydrolipoamide acetyltransferase)
MGDFKPGDVVKIDEVVATIEPQNGDSAAGAETSEPEAAVDGETVTEQATTEEAQDTAEPDSPAKEPGRAAEETPVAEPDHKATPLARKMAADMGLDLDSVDGSGALGKVTKADVLRATGESQASEEEPAPTPSEPPEPSAKAEPTPAAGQPATTSFPPAAEEDVLERHPLKGIRGVIARRMAESVHTTARVTLVTEVDATELVTLREQLKARYTEQWGFSPGYNDLLAMIVANALSQFPYMNARFSADGESIEYLKPINMGMAVDTERGLLVTVIRDADKKGLQELGTEFRDLVKKARSGKASLEELSGSTFTITSLGIFRVDAFTPVINLPEAAILGVGRIKEKPVVKDGEIVARKMLTLSLVFDHRLTDGAPAARFLDYICELIEEPYLLFLTRR